MNLDELKDDPFLSPSEIATIFRVKPYTVRMWIKDGKFDQDKIIKINNRLKVRRSAVQKFAQEQFGEN